MTGWKQGYLHFPDILFLAEWQDDFLAFSRKPRSHQTRGSLRNDDLTMRRNVITVSVRNESEILRLPRVEPKILLWQKNAAVISDIDHEENFATCFRRELLFVHCPSGRNWGKIKGV